MGEHLSTVVDTAMARLQGGEGVEAILADYFSCSGELGPLLDTAQELSLLRNLPAPEDPEAGLEGFFREARVLCPDTASPTGVRRRPVNWLARPGEAWLPRVLRGHLVVLRRHLYVLCGHPIARMAVSALCILLVLFALLGSMVALAEDSLPGDPIYPAKLVGEEMHLVFTVKQAARAEYHVFRVTARAEEMCRLVQEGRPIYESTVARMRRSLKASLLAASLASFGETSRLFATIEEMSAEQAGRLTTVEATGMSDAPSGTWSPRRAWGPRSVWASNGTRDTSRMLGHARQGLAQAKSLAQAGQLDVHAFRLNSRLEVLQISEIKDRKAQTP